MFNWNGLVLIIVVVSIGTCRSEKGESLSAKELLKTISPDYHTPKLPPGFPSLDNIQTNRFRYKTSKDYDQVSAILPQPVSMYPDYVTLQRVGINFTYSKSDPQNATWQVDVKGTWIIGSTFLPVSIVNNGGIFAETKSLSLNDLISTFLIKRENIDIGIDPAAVTLENVSLHARVSRKQNGMRAVFTGTFKTKTVAATKIKVVVIKNNFAKVQLYSVMEFKKARPERVLREILNQKILTVPFFAHMLTSSDLFFKRKDVFGLTFSFNEVYHYREKSMPGRIIRTVLQSHIPVGITLLSHMRILSEIQNARNLNVSKRSGSMTEYVKVAFVINQPAFDLLLSQKDKILISQLLPALSKELSTTDRMQRFNKSLRKAYTTHVSFDSSSTVFSIFVRLQETFQLNSPALKINVTNLVLQRNVGLDDKKLGWKVSAKGIYTMNGRRIRVKYSELTDDPGESFGLTGSANEIYLNDILEEFDPKFYPDDEAQTMIENTEIGSLKLYKVRIYSRGSDFSTTPHVLITGLANLPEWEKEIQVALLLLRKNGTWHCKWAASLKNSPLSNILQALTGYDSRNLKILHNNHIITTIISSPLPPYSLLPSYIITTRLLRLPVQKALTVVALLPFPEYCGDDKMCESATGLLDTSKVYTVSGVLSMNGYTLRAKLSHPLNISDLITGQNNTLQFQIGNTSKMDITTSFKIPGSGFMFDGSLTIDQSGAIEIDAVSRTKRWVAPFGMESLMFENMKLNKVYRRKSSLRMLKMTGTVRLGLPGNSLAVTSKVTLNYNSKNPFKSSFFANFSDITLSDLLKAYAIDVTLPNVLHNTFFPKGLVLSHGGQEILHTGDHVLSVPVKFQGYINIFGRLLNCTVLIHNPASIMIITENSPAPLLFAKGEIIIQKDSQSSLQGPKVIANIDPFAANVTIRGFVKVLGIESDVDVSIDNNVKFTVAGKLMEYKETILTAYSTDTLDRFQVYGCLEDIAFQVQLLLLEIISKSSNQSIVNKRKAEANYLNAQKYNEISEHEETVLRSRRDHDRSAYEEHLLEYGRFEVKVNDTCIVPTCEEKCFGCPRLEKCCRLDIFGHCIACSSWKTCCWKNVNPLCISKQDGCNVIRTAAQRSLAEKEDQILQERIELDNLDMHVLKAEINKGKHEAVLEAAIDAKQLVEEDSSPGLNAYDAIKNFGSPNGWAKINSVCYNTSIEQASTGCMNFMVASELFKTPEQNLTIWSCLKDDLVTELAESIANLIFPNIVDTADDGVTEVAEKLNSGEIGRHLEHLTANQNTAVAGGVAESGGMTPNTMNPPPDINQISITGDVNHVTVTDEPHDADLQTQMQQQSIDVDEKQEEEIAEHLPPPDKEKSVFDQHMSTQFKQTAPALNNFTGPTAPALTPKVPASFKQGGKMPKPMSMHSAGYVSARKKKKGHHAKGGPPSKITISAPKTVGGFLPSSGSGTGSGDLAEVDTELRNIYDGAIGNEQQTATAGVTGEEANEQVKGEQSVDVYEPNDLSHNEEEALADEIVEDEEKDENKLIANIHDNDQSDQQIENEVAVADQENSKMIQNETDLMLKYQYNPKYNLETDGVTYTMQHQRPSFYYPMQHNDTDVNSEYDGGDDGILNGQTSMALPNEYSLDEDVLKQSVFYLPRERERERRETKTSDDDSDAPLANDFSLDGDLMVEARKRAKDEGRTARERRDVPVEDLMSESLQHMIRKLSDGSKTKHKKKVKRAVVDADEPDLMRSARALNAKNNDKPSDDAPDLMSESVRYLSLKNTQKERRRRKRRSLDAIGDVIKDKKEEVIHDEKIEERLKRDMSGLYGPEESGTNADNLDEDELFKQKLNEQHRRPRTKRSENADDMDVPTNHQPDPNKRLLFSKPFWDVKSERSGEALKSRQAFQIKQEVKSEKRSATPGSLSKGGSKQSQSKATRRSTMMSGMLRKRWKIPENSNGRCHIYHQLIAICKDMADTIVMLDKSLNRSRSKFLNEDKEVYTELFDSEEYLVTAAKRINISGTLVTEAEKTLTVVRQGVNIWSRRCTSEFDWQNQSGVQTWIQAMDYKIQELGGFGVYRFLENLFHAFQALFEVLTLGNTAAARDAIDLLHRTHRISKSFDRIFKDKLSVTHSRIFANEILSELEHLRKDTLFC